MADRPTRPFSTVTIVLIVCIIVLLLVIGVLVYQIGRSGPPPPPPMDGPPPRPLERPGRELKEVEGLVKDYIHNEHLDINGIRLEKAGEGMLTYEFHPHAARAVLSVAQPGKDVLITYDTRPNDEEIGNELHAIKDVRTGKSVNIDQLPPPPRVLQEERPLAFTLERPTVLTDSYGGVVALRSGGKLFHFRPEQVEDIQALVKKGRNVKLLSVQRNDDQGFVNAQHDQVYVVVSITIDDRTFRIR